MLGEGIKVWQKLQKAVLRRFRDTARTMKGSRVLVEDTLDGMGLTNLEE